MILEGDPHDPPGSAPVVKYICFRSTAHIVYNFVQPKFGHYYNLIPLLHQQIKVAFNKLHAE